jgi:dTDP-4-amino-4,6-dideoxygalactose transaminase
MNERIPHSRPFIGKAERTACCRVIDSKHLSQGAEVEALERELSEYIGHRYGIAVSSGTAALYLALRALDIGSGDSVVIPTYVCTALLNALALCGARPVLSDVDPESGNLDYPSVKKVMHKSVRAIIVPHLFGTPAPIPALNAFGVPIIEDCAQCVGTTIGKKPVGAHSTISIFSFYSTKVLAAGEGGMVCCSKRSLAHRIRDYREYDKRSNYIPRFNFKLSDIHAAVARVQVGKIDTIVAARRKIAQSYNKRLHDMPEYTLPTVKTDGESIYYRYILKCNRNARRVAHRMRSSGIECAYPVYTPLHRYLGKAGYPNADAFNRSALSIPIYPGLAPSSIDRIVNTLTQ